MNITKSNNMKEFRNGQYFWRFNMKFRLNQEGDVDSYYEEPLSNIEFWLEQRARGKWERQKNTIFINHPTDMLMFSMNFSEYIRNVLESSTWEKELNTSKITKEDEEADVKTQKPSNITEVDDRTSEEDITVLSIEDDEDF